MSADVAVAYTMLMQVLTDNPAMCDRLLATHAIDETGRCRSCRAGNHNTGHTFGCLSGSAARRVAAARHPAEATILKRDEWRRTP